MSAKINCTILRETDKAIQIRQESRNREPVETWIPRSQCDHISKRPSESGDINATVTMATWLADERGLQEEA